jgi:hypothetical protein
LLVVTALVAVSIFAREGAVTTISTSAEAMLQSASPVITEAIRVVMTIPMELLIAAAAALVTVILASRWLRGRPVRRAVMADVQPVTPFAATLEQVVKRQGPLRSGLRDQVTAHASAGRSEADIARSTRLSRDAVRAVLSGK